jgi:hypothetical protein
MTIDERLDKLTDRHEAITHSLELLHLDTLENTKNIATLSIVVHKMAASIDTLGRIVESHENRPR